MQQIRELLEQGVEGAASTTGLNTISRRLRVGTSTCQRVQREMREHQEQG